MAFLARFVAVSSITSHSPHRPRGRTASRASRRRNWHTPQESCVRLCHLLLLYVRLLPFRLGIADLLRDAHLAGRRRVFAIDALADAPAQRGEKDAEDEHHQYGAEDIPSPCAGFAEMHERDERAAQESGQQEAERQPYQASQRPAVRGPFAQPIIWHRDAIFVNCRALLFLNLGGRRKVCCREIGNLSIAGAGRIWFDGSVFAI